jgi:S-DNA-T family DNA segregation ATPase FtsK/SpoIIIE
MYDLVFTLVHTVALLVFWLAVPVTLAVLGTVYAFRIRRWLRATPAGRAGLRLARYVRRGWPHLAINLGLAYTDQTTRHRINLHTGEIRPPETVYPAIRVHADEYGVIVDAATVPTVGVEEYTKAAPHLANAWGCATVQVRQIAPGVVRLRALLTDPVLTANPHVPVRGHATFTAVNLGRDEQGQAADISLVNVSGITVGGLPGYGKTGLIAHLFTQLAPNPAVQFAVLDGKGGADYDDLSPRCFLLTDDDIHAANTALERLFNLMRDRHDAIKGVRGTANVWHAGPDVAWPLVVVIVDESHTFVQTKRRKIKEIAEENAWYLEQLAKKGRSVGFVLIMITQKQTGDAIPTYIRDVCQVGLSFACRTTDAAVAALGDDIRQYPDANPTRLLAEEFVGVMVARLPGWLGFTRVRAPYVPEDFAAKTAQASAPLTADPAALLAKLTGGDDGPRLVKAG